jgi:SNF2 family DNA or RNA helicase
VKDDVELNIPKKSEKTINTRLTKTQHKYYQAVLNKKLNDVLSEKAVKQLRNKGNTLPINGTHITRNWTSKYVDAVEKSM